LTARRKPMVPLLTGISSPTLSTLLHPLAITGVPASNASNTGPCLAPRPAYLASLSPSLSVHDEVSTSILIRALFVCARDLPGTRPCRDYHGGS
jgi:hypothetical protein